jgi:anti-sigma regulatory factor (Ser/Thr protein kinase)
MRAYSFRSVRADPESAVSSIHVELTMNSDIAALLPVVDELMLLIRKSRCVPGGERDVECALREALDNAVVHGNREDPDKQVHISCRCEPGKELSVVIRDDGPGFDPTKVMSSAITKGAQFSGRERRYPKIPSQPKPLRTLRCATPSKARCSPISWATWATKQQKSQLKKVA